MLSISAHTVIYIYAYNYLQSNFLRIVQHNNEEYEHQENWLLEYITTYVKPQSITIIKAELVGFKKERDYIRVKLSRNPDSSTSETYR